MDYYLLAFALGLARHCYTDLRYMLLYDSTNCFLLLVGLGRGWQQGMLEQAWQGAVVLGGLMLLLYYVCQRINHFERISLSMASKSLVCGYSAISG